ncbi:MAG: hypothetical protein HY000_08545 [Planctomycetes bacterium]|nr:hypothetical protein [Planctomycetota bacterium]
MAKKKAPKRRPPAIVKRPAGPYLAAAVLCEHVLHEKDGIHSLIRMFDRLSVKASATRRDGSSVAPAQVAAIVPPIPLTLFVGFKSGDFKGQKVLSVRVTNPDGQVMDADQPSISMNLVFEGDERGANAHITLLFKVKKSGLYWIDLFLDEEWVTSVPLRMNIEFGETTEEDREPKQAPVEAAREGQIQKKPKPSGA